MEEMNELFYRDPYKRSFQAEVVECIQGKDAWMTVLSDTAFYRKVEDRMRIMEQSMELRSLMYIVKTERLCII